ncbi:MAG: hypothetical protein RR614_04580, partial [Eubacterium sp.]
MIIYFFRALIGFLLQTLPPAFLCIYPFWSRLSWERKRPILFFFFGGFLVLGLFIALIFVDTLNADQPTSNVNLINTFMFLEQFCCFIIYMLVIRDHFFKKLFCLIFVSSFFAGTALIASFLNRLLFPPISIGIFIQDGYLWTLPALTLFFLVSVIAFFSIFKIMRQMTQYMFEFDRPVFWRNLCVLPVLFYLWIFFTPNDLLYGWIIVSATFIMLLLEIFIALFSIQNMKLLTVANVTTPPSESLMDEKTLLSHEAYLSLNEKLQKSEFLCHDWKHQLYVFKRMLSDGDFEQATNHIDALLSKIVSVKPILLSGNYLIDTLVNGRLSKLSKENVDIDVQATIPEILPFDYEELYILFHEILTCAVKGCESVASEPAKLILNLNFSENTFHIKCTFPTFDDEYISFKNIESLLVDYTGKSDFSKVNQFSEISVFLSVSENKA